MDSPVSLPPTTTGTKPTPAPTPTSTPSPSPTPSPTPVNDSLVQAAAVPSLDSGIYAKRTFQGIPSIARIDKRLWAVWYGDITPAKWEAPGNFLILSYSDNDGKTWSREFYLVPASPTTDRAFDPRLWVAPDGKLWVIYAQSGGGKLQDGQMGSWVNVILNPLADTPAFEPGFRLADGIPHQPVKYGGNWFIPVDYLNSVPARFPERFGNHLFRLNWESRTAYKVATVPKTPRSDFNEPTYVELKDGSLLEQSRTYDGIYQSRTAPGALLFPTPTPWKFYTSAVSRHSLTRSPSGRLVIVFNKTNDLGRNDMTVALSEDEGATWPYFYTFDSRGLISYPDVTYDAKGRICVIYDHSRNGAKEIFLATIDEQSIVAGKPSSHIQLVNVPAQ